MVQDGPIAGTGRVPAAEHDAQETTARMPSPSPSRRLARVASSAVVTALAVTGLAAPVSHPRPIVERKVTTLTRASVAPGWRQSVHTALPTELVAVQWDGITPGSVDVRVRSRPGPSGPSSGKQGRWSGWLNVDGNPAEG